jgi:Domain of unknown function (DUF4345)
MTSASQQRRVLQITVGVLAFLPIGAGLAGAAFGIRVFDHASMLGADADNLGRYLSGLLLGIGLAFLTTLPRIEAEGVRFRLLTMIVFIGGMARLAGLIATGTLSKPILLGLVMELLATPALAFWREHVERLVRAT